MADIRVKIMVFQHDGTVVSQYLLGEGVHTIGRDPNSAIYVESEYISNEHAKLHLTDEGIFIEDLNSTSGTFLDDVTVRGKLRLNPDQRLKVGDLYIDLQLEGAGDLSPGVKIGAGRYQLVKELGRGAMGQVWLGQDTQLDELVAIKVLSSEVANDAVSLLDLKREVQKSRKLSHDNIIRIHDLVQLPGENPFISLEYVEGTDLHAIQLNQPDRIFQWADVKPYVLQLCQALDYAHERKIVHRDLKPPNIMIAKDGVLKLADFGIAASIVDATGRSSMADFISGTPQFMSPQQMLGKSPKASDDIYALGATIYDLLTGRPPFHTGDIAQQVQHVTPAPIEQRLAEFGLQNSVPDYVNSVVLSCLAKDPEARPTSAGAIAEWIRTEGKSDSPAKRKKTKTGVEKTTPEEPIQAEAESAAPVEAQPQPAKDKKTPVLAIAAVAVIAVIVGVLFLGKSGDQNENQNQGDGPQAGGKGATEGQPAISTQMQAKLKEGLVAYYPFNGNANDESSNGNDGEVKGADLTTDRFGNSGTAYSFDGNGAKIVLPAFKYGQRFTVCIWVNSHSTDGSTFLSKKPSYHVDSLSFGDSRVGGGTYTAIVYSGNDTHVSRSAPNPGPITREWSHLIFSYDGGQSHSSIRIYKDGIQIDDTDIPSEKGTFTVFNDLEVKTEIGSQNSNTEPKTTFLGKLDDVRIYNRVLSANEITALYDLEKPDYTKILKQGLVAYYPFNGNAKDESGNGNDGQVNGATLATDRNGVARRAYRFDGDDYINLGNKPQFNFKSGDFSISTWIQSPSYKGNQYLVGKYGGSNPGYGLGIRPDPESRIYAFIRDGVGRWVDAKSEAKLDQQNWYHVVATYDRTGSLVIYIDGVASGAVGIEKESGSIDDKNQDLTIGLTSSFYFKGSIDDVRIYNRALSAGEITALYNLEKPKADLKSGLVAYYPFNGNAKDETGNGHDGEVKGPTLTVDRHGKANSAYAFPSKDDFISVPEAPEFEGAAHTISLWFNSDATKALSQGTTLICKDNGSQRQWQVAEISNRRIKALVWTSEGMKTINSKAQYNIGQWHQLTQTWDGKKLGLFIDGKLDAEVPAAGPLTAGDQPILIGAQGGYAFKGSLDDIRFYNRALSAEEVTALYDQEKPSSETASGTQKPGTLLWEFEGAGGVVCAPAIGADGTVYVGSGLNVYALDGKTGAQKWEYQTESFVVSSPAIGADGTIYIGSSDEDVYAFNGKTGQKLWVFDTSRRVNSSPAIGSDGTVYIGSDSHKVYALDGKSGAKKWEFETGDKVYSSPAIGSDGTVYVGSQDNKLYAINGKTGDKLWEFETGSNVYSSPAIGSDGTVYVGSEDKKLYAINGKSGVKLWEFETGDKVYSSPAIGSDGTVYVGSDDFKLYAVNGKSGVKLWEFETGNNVRSSPAIGSDGTVYVGSSDKKVYALDGASGAKQWEFVTGGDVESSPVIGADGTMYIGSKEKNYIYAIATSSKGLAKSPWPMRGQNAQHTGRASATTNSPEAAAAIEAAIRKEAGKPTGELTKADLEKVTRLELENIDITDLTPLNGLVNLNILVLGHNKITDLTPLVSLKKLTQLGIEFNQITDLTPLSAMKKMEQIWLGDNQITELSPLSSMTGLKQLFISNNPDLTKEEIAKIQKVLPACLIQHNAKK